jgi:4-amino-4-deoxy-L-arabinose transferase-like glycosyltransferase
MPAHNDTTAEGRLIPWLRYVVAGMAAAFLLLYGYIALSRLGYPYDLQWMEGGMVDHVRRVLAGEPLYVAPSVDFVPYIYTPLYFYLAAGLSALLGVSLLPLRLISLIASLGCFALAGLLVYRETRDRLAGLLAAGLLAASFELGGAWFDLARIDTLFLFLTLLGIYLARFLPGMRGALAAGVVFSLAALTKQTALMIAAPLALYYLLTDWRRCVAFALPLAIIVGGSTLIFDALSDGWYWYYVFDLPGQHPWVWRMLVDFWRADLAPLVVALAFGGVYLLAAWRESKRRLLFYGLLSGGMILSAWLSRLHEGGYVNVLFPALAALAVLFGLGAGHIAKRAAALPESRRDTLTALVYVLAALQFIALLYNPAGHIPTRADHEAGGLLVDTVAALEGEVWLVHRGYVASLAGQETIYAHRMAIEDVMRGDDNEIRAALAADIVATIAEGRIDALIFDGSRDGFILVDYYFPNLQEHYAPAGEIFPPEMDDHFWPLAGLQVRPHYLFLRRE